MFSFTFTKMYKLKQVHDSRSYSFLFTQTTAFIAILFDY